MNELGGLYEGLDTSDTQERKEEKVMEFAEERKKRKPFHCWTVGGREYRLKLKASANMKLENKYKKNIMDLVMDDGIPPLSVMLTIIQAAMEPWEHGISFMDIQKLYDKWTEEEGGNQMDLQSKVIIPLMMVSGFFTEELSEQIQENL